MHLLTAICGAAHATVSGTLIPRAAAREINGMGYRLQMLIKLGVASHAPTEFYVTFDCDVVRGLLGLPPSCTFRRQDTQL